MSCLWSDKGDGALGEGEGEKLGEIAVSKHPKRNIYFS